MNDSISSKGQRALAGLLAGLIAGLLFSWLVNPEPGLILNLLICAIVGLLFGLVFGPKIDSYGTGLVWGEAVGLFWWFLGSLTLIPLLSGQKLPWDLSAMEQMFPLLLGQVVAYGAVLGLSYYGLLKLLNRYTAAPEAQKQNKPIGQPIAPSGVQAVIVGGISGTIGSLFFLSGMNAANFFPLVAGLAGSDSSELGQLLHYIIGTIIGVTFGTLFLRDIRQVGTGVIWGLNYGFLWWIIGPLTLMPWIMGQSPRWHLSVAASDALAPSLMAHLLYGTIVAWSYTLVNKVWHILFVDSDPLNRPEEGAGTRGVRGALIGGRAGIVGGLLFAVVMWGSGELPRVVELIDILLLIVRILLHLFISVIIGMIYGLFFQSEAATYRSGLGWGLTYGLLWWVIGASTLFFIFLGEPVDWSLQGIVGRYPALVGHLLYGAGLGLSFPWLAQRYDTPAPQNQAPTPDRPVPALWVVTVVLGVMLPLLFSIRLP